MALSKTVNDLIKLTQDELMGYSNALTNQQLLEHLNSAKNAMWKILKTAQVDYFGTSSQSTTSTADNYFAALNTAARQYTLPPDFREMRFIEVTAPIGYEQTRFIYRKISHVDFQTARRNATEDKSQQPALLYFYTIIGKDQFVLAQFPEVAFQLVLWYIRSIPDFVLGDQVDEVLAPYSDEMAVFAAKRIMLMEQDQVQWDAWAKEWKEGIIQDMEASAPRQSSDVECAMEYNGD